MPTPSGQDRFEPFGIEPSYAKLITIPHYYGDVVRALFLFGAALMLLASPLYGNSLRAEFPYEILGAILAVALAALTSPRSRWVMMADAALAAVGTIIFASWGFMENDTISALAFVLRIAIAVISLFAFYYSMKTVRAMSAGLIGKREDVQEFKEPLEPDERD